MKKPILLLIVSLLVILLITGCDKLFSKDLCEVDTDCVDYKYYCEKQKTGNICLQFYCGEQFGLGIGDFWTCGDDNVCLLMCDYNLNNTCVVNYDSIKTFENRGCVWHKQIIQEPIGGFTKESVIKYPGWICG